MFSFYNIQPNKKRSQKLLILDIGSENNCFWDNALPILDFIACFEIVMILHIIFYEYAHNYVLQNLVH